MTEENKNISHSGDGHSDQVGHIVALPILLAVWAALLIGTVLTVVIARVDLGPLNLFGALGALSHMLADQSGLLVVKFAEHEGCQ